MGQAVRVENLSKRYLIGVRNGASFRDSLIEGMRRLRGRGNQGDARNTFWALKDVSFDVEQGEVLGVVGRNGAGKSTLLKILSRIVDPTTGRIKITGRVGSLLEVGTGFHPELTGRENVFLNGAILGMRSAEIERKFDEIVDFSGVERFIDTPVKRYSSGMFVRLAFAVAAHLEPEILIVDEVLAVGDVAFQKKCLGKMQDVAGHGRTILFVSHNMSAVLSLCSRCIYLEKGQLRDQGSANTIVGTYLREIAAVSTLELAQRTDRQGNQQLRFLSFEMLDSEGIPITSALTGQDVTLAFRYTATFRAQLKNVQASIGVHGRVDEGLFYLSTEIRGDELGELPLQGVITCRIPAMPLLPGSYSFNLFSTVNGEIADWVQNAGVIEVEPGDFFGSGKLPPIDQGSLVVAHQWGVRDDVPMPSENVTSM